MTLFYFLTSVSLPHTVDIDPQVSSLIFSEELLKEIVCNPESEANAAPNRRDEVLSNSRNENGPSVAKGDALLLTW